ncbi:MAG: Germination-specific N-acetylmuramoyl-L-alanine amidase precursor [Pelotomaculum sp. PtaU1.Bin035]|nr:MAG: Germination-specific N-acetylmuramoyl-L-alanine amidase precursor [Pelotomaculum sp. PtaU1.Bin035]
MPLIVVKAFKIRMRWLAVLVALVFLSFPLAGLIRAMDGRKSVAAMSWSVANKVIVVDPGHGGFDPGVVSKSGILEKDINLAIGKRLAADLGQAGAMVLMTRDTDIDLSGPGTIGVAAKKKEDMKKRVALANDHNADLFISIHVNSVPSPAQCGARTFVQPGFSESKQAGQAIQTELSKVLKNTGRLTNEVDYYVTRNTSMPAVLVETGFITNESESRLLQDPAYQAKVAWAIYAGAVKYFSLPPESIIKTFKEKQPDLLREP